MSFGDQFVGFPVNIPSALPPANNVVPSIYPTDPPTQARYAGLFVQSADVLYTLGYLEITQPDLQREFHLARSHPRHWAPSRALCSASPPRADLVGLIDSLETAQHVLEMYRRNVADNSARRLLDRLANRIVKILAETRRLNKPQE